MSHGFAEIAFTSTVQALQEQQPLGAMGALKAARFPGPLFNSYTWGGYLAWRSYGQDPVVVVDGMTSWTANTIQEKLLQAVPQ